MTAADQHDNYQCSDEMIMAFVDGELDRESARRVREAIEANPDLQEKAAMFAESAAMLEGVYDAPLQEEVPERLLKTVREFDPHRERSESGLFARLQRFFSGPLLQPLPVFALVVIILLGGFYVHYGRLSLSPGDSGPQAVVHSPSFAQAMEKSPDGRIVTLGGSTGRVSPVATFIDRQHRFCRRYDVLDARENNRIIGRGIACRAAGKQWRTIVYQQVPARAEVPSSYEPAGSDNPVDRVMNRELSDLLNEQQVRKLIDNDWTGL